MNSRARTLIALLLLQLCGALMLTVCTLIGSGREMAVAVGLPLHAGTWLNASPRKVQALLLVAVALALLASAAAAWLMRAEPRSWTAAALVLSLPGMLLPPWLLSAATNPALSQLSARVDISTGIWPLWPEWSDHRSALRSTGSWPAFQRAAQHWVRNHEGALALPTWASNVPRRALGHMHIVSQLWGPGNLHATEREGCVRSNEDTGWRVLGPVELGVTGYLSASIACCDDYAHMLMWLLQGEGIESRLVAASGHIFVEARLDGRWRVLDAMLNAYMDRSFDEINRGDATHVLLASHAAEVQNSSTYRAKFTIDRWRLLSTIVSGGHGHRYQELPAVFPAHP